MVKITLYNYDIHKESKVSFQRDLQSPNFSQLHSMTSSFRDTRMLKIGNAPNDLRMTLTFKGQSTLYTSKSTFPRGQILVCFALSPTVFEMETH